jgi:hypothetical protein
MKTLKIGIDSQIISKSHSRRVEPVIVSDLLAIFTKFRGQQFSLLWWSNRDDLGAGNFRTSCDRHPNTLTFKCGIIRGNRERALEKCIVLTDLRH